MVPSYPSPILHRMGKKLSTIAADDDDSGGSENTGDKKEFVLNFFTKCCVGKKMKVFLKGMIMMTYLTLCANI